MKSFKTRMLARVWSYWHQCRIQFYLSVSKDQKIIGTPIIKQPTLFEGQGTIVFGRNVNLGNYPSPKFYDGSIYIEARSPEARISIGNDTYINNNSTIVADKSSIEIGANVLMGTNVEIIDSDFHNLDSKDRTSQNYVCLPIVIGNNVFLGSNVRVLKGVTIGENSVIGNGSLVINDIPPNVIAAGVPAKVLKAL